MQGVSIAPICSKHLIGKKKITDRHSSSGYSWRCTQCAKEQAREFRNRHRERVNEQHRKYIEANPEKVRASQRKSRYGLITVGEFTMTRSRAHKIYTGYRLRPEDLLELYNRQDRKCMLGGEPLAWEDIQVDHKHRYPGCHQVFHKTSGTYVDKGCPKESVRGLACSRHNTREGQYEADPEGYMAVAKWHVEHNGGKWSDICS